MPRTSRTPVRHPVLVTSALAALLTLPAPAVAQLAVAQQPLDPVRVTAASTARADSLFARAARREIQSIRDFRKVAAMYEKSAELREVGDEKRFEALQMAARLRYGSGERRQAADDMEQAAQEAAARGDVVNAADSYIDAAHLAVELRERERALKFVRTAELLTRSPLLSEQQRAAVQTRIAARATTVQEVAALLHP